jgi:organic radical activating enzyme
VFKFVIADEPDITALAVLQHHLQLDPVWVMPEGTTEQAVLAASRALADEALAHGWNLTLRLHVLLWGDERGR